MKYLGAVTERLRTRLQSESTQFDSGRRLSAGKEQASPASADNPGRAAIAVLTRLALARRVKPMKGLTASVLKTDERLIPALGVRLPHPPLVTKAALTRRRGWGP